MKVITRTSSELVLRPPVGITVWLAVVSIVVMPIVSLLPNNRISWWVTLGGSLFWLIVVGALIFVPVWFKNLDRK